MRTLVLGLGNEYAGDDAAGVLAVRALRGALAGMADVVESAASGLALIEVFAGYERAVIVDSIRTGRSPAGTIIEPGLGELGRATAPSLHQAGIPELAAVARRLGMGFPDRTRVLAVEVAGPLMFGTPLSEPVAAAVVPLARRILDQIRLWASEDSGDGLPEGARVRAPRTRHRGAARSPGRSGPTAGPAPNPDDIRGIVPNDERSGPT